MLERRRAKRCCCYYAFMRRATRRLLTICRLFYVTMPFTLRAYERRCCYTTPSHALLTRYVAVA